MNLAILHDRVLVAIDTRGGAAEDANFIVRAVIGSKLNVSKATYLPGPGAVLAGRGTPALLYRVAEQAALKHYRDFDALVAGMPKLLKDAHKHLLGVLGRSGLSLGLDEQEIAAVGFSKRAGRMAAVIFSQETRAQGFEEFHLDDALPSWEGPWWDEGDAPAWSTPAEAMALARQQVAAARRLGHRNIGGRLILIDARRDAVQFLEACTLE